MSSSWSTFIQLCTSVCSPSLGTLNVKLLIWFSDALAVCDVLNFRGPATCETESSRPKCLLTLVIRLENHTQSIFPLDGRPFEHQMLCKLLCVAAFHLLVEFLAQPLIKYILCYSRHLHRLHVSTIDSHLQAYFCQLCHNMLCTLWDPIVFTPTEGCVTCKLCLQQWDT